VIDNALEVDSKEQSAPGGRQSVISSGTRIAGAVMVLAVAILTMLDYLFSTGALGQYVLAVLTLVPLAVAVIIVPVARSLGQGGTIRTQWTLFGMAMLSVGIGNVIFITLYITTGKDPYPSVADVFTLAMYAVLSAGFFLSIRAYKGLLDLRRPMLIAASVSSVVMAIVYFAVIGPYVVFAPAGSQPLVTRIFNTVYPVMDAFLLLLPSIALGLLASKLGAGRLAWPAWLVVAGASTLAVTDTAFAYVGYIGAGRPPVIDAGYAVAPMLLGLAVLVARDVYRS
jgi:hypothetical protein